MAIVLVEHDLQFVLGLSDQMIVLDFGTILATGTPTKICPHRGVDRLLRRPGRS